MTIEVQAWPPLFLGWSPDEHSIFIPGYEGDFHSCEGALNFVRVDYPDHVGRVTIKDIATDEKVLCITGVFG